MTVGEKIQELLDWGGKNQKELAELSGVSQSAISDYIRNIRIPSIEAAQKIADALDVSLWVLLNGEALPVTALDMTEKERRLIGEYRRLTGSEQEAVDHVIQVYNERKRRGPVDDGHIHRPFLSNSDIL
mgnify:CR=1 FL=1